MAVVVDDTGWSHVPRVVGVVRVRRSSPVGNVDIVVAVVDVTIWHHVVRTVGVVRVRRESKKIKGRGIDPLPSLYLFFDY